MTEIYLVRHGQASFASDNYDCLSDLGRQQSAFLGQYFSERDIKFGQVFTGTQRRHKQTAEAILPPQDSPPLMSHAGLNEYDFSALYQAYMTQHPDELPELKDGNRRIFYRRLKRALSLWSGNKLLGDLPESWSDFTARVSEALQHIRGHMDGPCLVVSSGGAISVLIGQILGLSADQIINLNLQIRNTGFSHIRLGHDALHLSSFNNIPHLDQPGRMNTITYS